MLCLSVVLCPLHSVTVSIIHIFATLKFSYLLVHMY